MNLINSESKVHKMLPNIYPLHLKLLWICGSHGLKPVTKQLVGTHKIEAEYDPSIIPAHWYFKQTCRNSNLRTVIHSVLQNGNCHLVAMLFSSTPSVARNVCVICSFKNN